MPVSASAIAKPPSRPIYIPPPVEPVFQRQQAVLPGTVPALMAAGALALFISPCFGFFAMRRHRLALLYLVHALLALLLALLLTYMDISLFAHVPPWFFYATMVNIAGTLHLAIRPLSPGGSPPDRRHLGLAALVAACVVAGGVAAHARFPSERTDGLSMAPTVLPGTSVLISRLDTPEESLQRGDLVLYTSTGPDRVTATRMSRILGLPGDTVAMHRGFPLVNGAPIERLPLPDCGPKTRMAPSARCYVERLETGTIYSILKRDGDGSGPYDNRPPLVVPPGRYYVISDNRDVARDSRDRLNVGLPSRDDIVGHVIPLRITPASRYLLATKLQQISEGYESLHARLFGPRPAKPTFVYCTIYGRQNQLPWRKCTPGAASEVVP